MPGPTVVYMQQWDGPDEINLHVKPIQLCLQLCLQPQCLTEQDRRMKDKPIAPDLLTPDSESTEHIWREGIPLR